MSGQASTWKRLLGLVAAFLAFYHLPVGMPRFDHSVLEALHLARWYAREHALLCLVPAFFIAGAVAAFLSKNAVMKYLGARAPKVVAYGVASVSGTLLAVCSCTVLPLFAGIYRMGAGLGPACSFLYSGPAINALAIILTAQILGWELGLARAVGAVVFAVVIGLAMHALFPEVVDPDERPEELSVGEEEARPLHQAGIQLGLLVAVLVFANWADPGSEEGLWAAVYDVHWALASATALALAAVLTAWFGVSRLWLGVTVLATALAAWARGGEPTLPFVVAVAGLAWSLHRGDEKQREWLRQTWDFAWQIMPLLLGGVLVAGLLLGRPGGEGLIPSTWVSSAVGGESLDANAVAALSGAFMYFATLTEVPILQGLLANGMGQGPALALLLAGPAVSLPNLLVIRSVLGTKKTAVFLLLVVVLATVSGWIYGNLVLVPGR